jgi:hypothetical protein
LKRELTVNYPIFAPALAGLNMDEMVSAVQTTLIDGEVRI